MNIKVTARHFKAHESLIEYATNAVEELERFYDGIVKAEVILFYEKPKDSVKIAEVTISVYGTVLSSEGRADEFPKAVDSAVEKILVQLKKYKERLHEKDKKEVLKVRSKS
ncbi:MAG TPA: ribosome-associated translation inhibitor RaiA [Bacteroidota bacterium]|nr:ribosome-associated translation inhibitor RaiA [Bacteroidota bacterium]